MSETREQVKIKKKTFKSPNTFNDHHKILYTYRQNNCTF